MDVRRWLLIALCVFTAVVQAQDVPGKVMLASEEWSDYTNKDGTGLAWDVLRQVFEPAGINLQTRSVPYTRSVGLAQRGEVDGWVGSYRNEAEGVLYPHWNFDSDHIYALGLASTRFHRRIVRASRNFLLERAWEGLQIEARTAIALVVIGPELRHVADEHAALLQVLQAGDVEAACLHSREHQWTYADLPHDMHGAARTVRFAGDGAPPAPA